MKLLLRTNEELESIFLWMQYNRAIGSWMLLLLLCAEHCWTGYWELWSMGWWCDADVVFSTVLHKHAQIFASNSSNIFLNNFAFFWVIKFITICSIFDYGYPYKPTAMARGCSPSAYRRSTSGCWAHVLNHLLPEGWQLLSCRSGVAALIIIYEYVLNF